MRATKAGIVEIIWAVNDNSLIIHSGPYRFDNGWSFDDDSYVTFTHGLMFENAWTPGTPHVIIKRDVSAGICSTIYSDGWSEDDTDSLTNGNTVESLFILAAL